MKRTAMKIPPRHMDTVLAYLDENTYIPAYHNGNRWRSYCSGNRIDPNDFIGYVDPTKFDFTRKSNDG